MTAEEFRLWAPVLLGVLSLMCTVGIFRLSSRKSDLHAQQAEIDGMKQSISKTESRIAKLETDFQHLPTKEQVHKLEISTTEMKGDIKAMNETMKAVDKTTGRMEGYLLSADHLRNSAA